MTIAIVQWLIAGAILWVISIIVLGIALYIRERNED